MFQILSEKRSVIELDRISCVLCGSSEIKDEKTGKFEHKIKILEKLGVMSLKYHSIFGLAASPRIG